MLPIGIKDIKYNSSPDEFRKFFKVCSYLKFVSGNDWENINTEVATNETVIVHHKIYNCVGVITKLPGIGSYRDELRLYWNNEHGPAKIEFNSNDTIFNISYIQHNRKGYHRPFYPASYRFFDNEHVIRKEEHWLFGKRHNSVGPAVRERSSINGRWNNRYYLNGKCVDINQVIK